jgi:hypothetical protein
MTLIDYKREKLLTAAKIKSMQIEYNKTIEQKFLDIQRDFFITLEKRIMDRITSTQHTSSTTDAQTTQHISFQQVEDEVKNQF